MSKEELLHGFVVFAGAMIEAFERYLEHPSADLREDPVAFRQAAIWLNDTERADLVERLRDAFTPYLENEPTLDRERLLVNTVLIPDRSTPPTSED